MAITQVEGVPMHLQKFKRVHVHTSVQENVHGFNHNLQTQVFVGDHSSWQSPNEKLTGVWVA